MNKIKWNSKYKTISAYVIITVTILALIILFFTNFSTALGGIGKFFSILTPFIIGFAAAYLLYRPASFIEKHVFAFVESKKPRPGLRRTLSIITLFFIVFGIFVLLIYFIIPQLFESATILLKNIPNYLTQLEGTVTNWLDSIHLYTPEVKKGIIEFQDTFLNFTSLLNNLLAELPTVISTVGTGIFNFFVGMIVCVYVLYSREKFLRQSKQLVFAVFKEGFAAKFLDVFRYSNDVFLGFIMGTLTSSAFVGVTTFVFMSLFRLPYALLIAVIIALTNIVPFFGPFLGAIPSIIILLIVDPVYALIFLIFILVLQQVDGNILLPKLIGMHVDLSAFWVLFALLVGGGLFGFWGLLLGVPIFAVIYSLVATLVKNRLKKKDIPVEYYTTPKDKILDKHGMSYHEKRKARQQRREERESNRKK